MKTLCFLSLQLEIISHECLTWVMASLKRDEMTPTEKALQNRIKEAFAFKISASLWDCITQSLDTNSSDIKTSNSDKNKKYIVIEDADKKASNANNGG